MDRRAFLAAPVTFALVRHPDRGASTPEASPAASTAASALIEWPDIAGQLDDVQLLGVVDSGSTTPTVQGSIRMAWQDFAFAREDRFDVVRWAGRVSALLTDAGLDASAPTVCYDPGDLFSAFARWALTCFGLSAVVLDRGQRAIPQGVQGTMAYSLMPIDPDQLVPSRLATKDRLLAALDGGDLNIIDARSPDEYRAGHIPRAINWPYKGNVGEDGAYLPADDIASALAERGVNPATPTVTYCTSGARGSVDAFACDYAGFRDVSLYLGSWPEWSSDPSNPIDT